MSKYLGTNGHIYIDLSATRLFDLTDGTIINKLAVAAFNYLLQEDGFFLLQEDGSKIIL